MAVLNTGPRFDATLRPPRWPRSARLLAALALGWTAVAAQPLGTREYQLKAVFLFNFAQFVEWPAAAFAAPASPLVIGVLGADPFGAYLDETVRDETIGPRALLVRRYRRVEEIDRCHILFISGSEAGRGEEIVARLHGRSILTVCETAGLARHGIMIRFLPEGNKIRLRINLDAAKAAGLVISSKLLRPAEIVTARGN